MSSTLITTAAPPTAITVDGVLWVPQAAPTPTPTPIPTPTPVPPSGYDNRLTGLVPASWADFPSTVAWKSQTWDYYTKLPAELIKNVSITSMTGNPSVIDAGGQYGGYTLQQSRISSREGPRVDGGLVIIDGCYIEVNAQAGDHADCIQCYQDGAGLTVKNSHLHANGAGATGDFAADASKGPIVYDTVLVTAGPQTPGFGLRVNNDGASTVKFRHVRVDPPSKWANAPIYVMNPAMVAEWTDVLYTDGTPVPHP